MHNIVILNWITPRGLLSCIEDEHCTRRKDATKDDDEGGVTEGYTIRDYSCDKEDHRKHVLFSVDLVGKTKSLDTFSENQYEII